MMYVSDCVGVLIFVFGNLNPFFRKLSYYEHRNRVEITSGPLRGTIRI